LQRFRDRAEAVAQRKDSALERLRETQNDERRMALEKMYTLGVHQVLGSLITKAKSSNMDDAKYTRNSYHIIQNLLSFCLGSYTFGFLPLR